MHTSTIEMDISQVLVFRTNVRSYQEIQSLHLVLDPCPSIHRWTVDTDDVDNVLRIEQNGEMTEFDVICLMLQYGFYCETLPD